MTIKSALSVVALAAGLAATPVFAQGMMIGSQTVAEADVETVKARCVELQTAADTGASATDAETANVDSDEPDEVTEGEATFEDEANDGTEEQASTLDLEVVTLEDCEAGGWFDM